MIKKACIVSLICTLTAINCSRSSAQTAPKEFVISAGAGYSLITQNVFVFGFNLPPILFTAKIPELGVTIDYGISNWLSLGIAASYQQVGEEYSDYFLKDYAVYSRTNLAGRILFHLDKNFRLNKNSRKVFDQYLGFRVGLSIWQCIGSGTSMNGYYILAPSLYNYYPSFQFLYGIKIYFTKSFGIHCEAGLGSPYLLEGGLTFRLGYHEPIEQPVSAKK